MLKFSKFIEHPNCGTPDCCMKCDTAVSEDDKLALQANVANQLFELEHVAAVVPAAISDDNKTLLFQAQ